MTAVVPDAELVSRCRTGDHVAWHELVERFSRYVFAIIERGYALRGGDAEDAFQDVWLRVWDKLDTLRSDDAVRPWIGQLTRHCCVDLIRRSGRTEALDEAAETLVDDRLSDLDAAIAVRESLAGLNEECREILDRFFCRDQSYRAIGDALGLPGGTIASRISRCLAKLRAALAPELEESELEPRPVGR